MIECYTLPNSNNKARVFKDSNGDEFLISYDTEVLVKHGDKLYQMERNIKEYCGLNKKQYLEF